ncbi:MAG: ATP-dependent Clp protease ATP-binding subunit [Patescibacteria group bacterium]
MPAFLIRLILFPVWWLYSVPVYLLKLLRKISLELDHRLAVSLMLRTMFVPLFGDTSVLGFFIGIIFRSFRVVFGILSILFADLLFLFLILFWLLVPYGLLFRLANPRYGLCLLLLFDLLHSLLSLLQYFANRNFLKAMGRETQLRLDGGGQEDLTQEDREATRAWVEARFRWLHPPRLWEESYRVAPLGGFNRALTGRVTPTLDAYSSDLTKLAQRGKLPPLFGKKTPLDELFRVLEKESANNVILVGPTGCGKTSLVYGLANNIVAGTHSKALADRRLVSLELGVLSAGTRSGGELQERLVGLIRDIEVSGKIILFIDEVHNAVAAGGGVETSLIFSALEPHLSDGKFQMIGATSWENYRKYIEPHEAFSRLFETVEIPESSFAETLEVLQYLSLNLEKKYRLMISYPALKRAITLSARFVFDRVLPDKAIGILEETVVLAARTGKSKMVTAADVEELVTRKTHIPVTAVGGAESEKLLKLEEKMHERLIGQDEAISAIADAVRRARVGLRDPNRPIVSLLFVGPTGVGKTEAAKTLAQNYFGNESAFISFDMSEYQREDSVNRLLGSPASTEPGAQLGLLTEKVRKNPFSLVLFDEVEKSHPRLLDLFLQILEEGRLTDAAGHTVNFSNTMLIFTSNAGTETIYQGLKSGRSISEISKNIFSFLSGSFRIELLNRFDGVVVFSPLTREQVNMVVRLKLRGVSSLGQLSGLAFSFTDELIDSLSRLGYDPALGARPLRRLIQDKIEAHLAKKILSGAIKKGEAVILGTEILEE